MKSIERHVGKAQINFTSSYCREQRTRYRKHFEFPVPGLEGEGRDPDHYYYRMYLVSIWGLWNSSNENPFCLIDQFLRCDQAETGDQMNPLMEAVDEEGSESISLM